MGVHDSYTTAEEMLDIIVSEGGIEAIVPFVLATGPTPPTLNVTPGLIFTSSMLSSDQKEAISQW